MPTYDEVVQITWGAEQPLNVATELISKLQQVDTLLGQTIPTSIGKMGASLEGVNAVLSSMARNAQAYADAMGRAGSVPMPATVAGGGATVRATGVPISAEDYASRMQAFVGGDPVGERLRQFAGGFGGFPQPAGDPFATLRAQAQAYQQQQFAYATWQQQYVAPFVNRQDILRASGEAEYYQQAQMRPLQDPGREMPALRKAFLQEGLEDALRRQATALKDVHGEVAGAGERYEAASTQVKGFQRQIQEADGGLTGFSRTILRHLTTLAVMIVAYEALRIVGQTIRQVADEFIRLEAASARVGFITGQGVAGARPDIMGQVLEGARYGVQPQETQQAAIVAAQLRSTAQQQEEARQIALVFGTKEYTNALRELYQTEQRARAENISHIDTMGYLATATTVLTGSFEEYMDALQAGIALQSKLGVSSEQAALAILRISAATETAPDSVGSMLQRVTRNLERPEIQQLLGGQFGIQPGAPAQMWREIAQVTSNLVNQGQIEQADRLMQILFGGSLQAGKQLQDAKVAVMSLGDSFAGAQQPLGDFNKLAQEQLKTTQSHVEQLSAAWNTFLTSLSVTPSMKAFFDWLNGQIQGTTAGLLRASQGFQAQEQLGGMAPSERMDVLRQFVQETGGGTLRQLFDVQGGKFVPRPEATRFLEDPTAPGLAQALGWQEEPRKVRADLQSFLEFAQQGRPIAGGRGPLTDILGRKGEEYYPFTPTTAVSPVGPEFGGFGNLPPGVKTEADWNRFVDSVRGFEKTLSAQVPGYIQNPKEIAFWDESLGAFRKLVGDSEAIALATKAIQENTTKIQGAFNVPAGGEALIAFYAAQAGFMPNVGGGRAGTGVPSVSPMQYFAGGMQGPGTPGRETSTPFYYSQQEYQDWWGKQLSGRATTTPSRPSRFQTEQFRRHNEDVVQGPGGTTVNNRITVMIDGQVVSSTLNRQLHQRSYGNNSVGGNPSSLLAE